MLWMKHVMTALITLIGTMRRIAAMGLLGCLMLAFVPLGCGSHLGPITANQVRSEGHTPVPGVTVERLKACLEEYGEQLPPGSHTIRPVIKADKNGVKWSVTEDDIPNTAPEFAACTRQALRDMEIPAEFFKLAATMEQRAKGNVSKAQRSNMGSPLILVAIVAIGLSELTLEAGAYRIEVEFAARAAVSDIHVREIQRRITEIILQEAIRKQQSFAICQHWWNHLCLLGFSDIERRCTMTWFYADGCLLHEQFDVGLAVVEPLIAELETSLAEPICTERTRRFYRQELGPLFKLRDELKAYPK